MDLDAATAAPFIGGAFTSLSDAARSGNGDASRVATVVTGDADDDDQEGEEDSTLTINFASGDATGASTSASMLQHHGLGRSLGASAASSGPRVQAEQLKMDPMQEVLAAMVRAQTDSMRMIQETLRQQQQQNNNIVAALNGLVDAQQRGQSKKMVVSQFDGHSESAETWLLVYERACEANRWLDDQAKVNNLKASLKPASAADRWFNSRLVTNPNSSWAEWKAAFEDAFKQNYSDATARAMRYEYRGGSVIEFYYELERLLTLAYGSGVVAAEGHRLLINNVTVALPRDMQQHLIQSDPRNKAALISCLQRLTIQPRAPRTTVPNQENRSTLPDSLMQPPAWSADRSAVSNKFS